MMVYALPNQLIQNMVLTTDCCIKLFVAIVSPSESVDLDDWMMFYLNHMH